MMVSAFCRGENELYCHNTRETTEEKGSENYDNSSQTANNETVPSGIVKFLNSPSICYLC